LFLSASWRIKMKEKILLITSLIVFFLATSASAVRANYMYGNGEKPRQIVVEKWVQDNRMFVADDQVIFKMVVKNSGEEALTNIQVVDYLPDFVNFVAGPEGAVQDGREIRWTIARLEPGEEKEFELWAKVADSETLAGKGSFCLINRVQATAETGEWDEDTAEICLETRVLGAEALPEAGADLALAGVASVALTSLALFLKKRGQ
jgi:uncharacterized repeat protein (TIGR01451 family)